MAGKRSRHSRRIRTHNFPYLARGPWRWHILSIQLADREISKNSSTFSATNTSSNIVWVLQLHDTIQMKSNYTWINYKHDKIAIRSHIMIYNFLWKLIFGSNLVALIPQKEKNSWFFGYNLLTCSVRRMVLKCLLQNIDMCFFCINLIKSHAWNHISLITFPNEYLPCNMKMLLNLVAKMKFYASFYVIKWLLIIVDSCIISFNLNCIMQLKQFYDIHRPPKVWHHLEHRRHARVLIPTLEYLLSMIITNWDYSVTISS